MENGKKAGAGTIRQVSAWPRRVGALLLAVLMAGALAACGSSGNNSVDKGSASKKVYQIGVVQYIEHPAMDAAYAGFKEELAAKGYKDGDNIKLDFKNGQGDTNNLNTIANQFIGDKKDLILAIATSAAQAVASQTQTIPIIGTAITDYEAAKLVVSNDKPGRNVTGTSDLVSIADQIKLGKELVPTAKTVGLLYSSSEPNSVEQIKLAKTAIANLGMSYKEVTVASPNDVQQATQSLVGKCDYVFIPTDNTLASAMQTVAGITTPAKLVTIVGADTMVDDGGFATMGIDYTDLGRQTADMAVQILSGEKKPADLPIEWTEKTSVTINADLVKAFGITIPTKYADAVKAPAASK